MYIRAKEINNIEYIVIGEYNGHDVSLWSSPLSSENGTLGLSTTVNMTEINIEDIYKEVLLKTNIIIDLEEPNFIEFMNDFYPDYKIPSKDEIYPIEMKKSYSTPNDFIADAIYLNTLPESVIIDNMTFTLSSNDAEGIVNTYIGDDDNSVLEVYTSPSEEGISGSFISNFVINFDDTLKSIDSVPSSGNSAIGYNNKGLER